MVAAGNQQPIEYATVALLGADNEQIVTGAVTDSLGRFKLKAIRYGTYKVVCSYIGFADYTSPTVNISSLSPTIDLKTIELDQTAEAVEKVVVSTRQSTYIQTIDKKIFNVGADIASGSGAVSDLLQNVPSLSVDLEGNVALRGNENVQVLIDGKPSVLMRGTNRGTVLQQIPASSVERIEVITNPSAQFKPDGTSGIINLVMKKNRAAGTDGSIDLNAGNGGRANGTVSLGISRAKFGINGTYGYRRDRRDRWTYNTRTLTDAAGNTTYVEQNTVSKAPSSSHIGSLGLQWRPTANDAFEASGSIVAMTFPRTEDNRMVQQQGAVTQKDYVRHRFDNERQQEGEATAVYTHTFGEDHNLVVDYTYALQNEVERNQYTNIYTLPAASQTADNTVIRQRNDENLVRAIYSNRLDRRNNIVTGFQAELDKSDMRYLAEDLVGTDWIKNSERSNDFTFDENVLSLYATWEHRFDRFASMIGVRGEQSYIRLNLPTLSRRIADNYFLFFPTLHTSYTLNKQSELQLNYSLRVNRPEGDDLNPFPEYQDPYNIKSGNPYLRPEKIHSVELGWQHKSGVTTLIVTPYYRYTFDKMTEITRLLEGGVVQTTKENLSSSSAAGTELIINSSLGKRFNFNINSNLFYDTIDASSLGYSANKSAFAWYVAANANLTVANNLLLQLNTRYNSSAITPQGQKLGTYIMNLGMRYQLPRQNLSITATCSDVFDSYKSVLVVHTPSIDQRVERRRTPRTFYIGICYRFGSNKQHHNSELQYDETL